MEIHKIADAGLEKQLRVNACIETIPAINSKQRGSCAQINALTGAVLSLRRPKKETNTVQIK